MKQPHDRASQPERSARADASSGRWPQRWLRRRVSPSHEAQAMLDHLVHDVPLAPLPEPREPSFVPGRSSGVPRRWLGHGAMLGLVAALIGGGGFPQLVRGMDWRQSSVVAGTDVVDDHDAEQTEQVAMQRPLVLTTAALSPNKSSLDEALKPSMTQRAPVAESAWAGSYTLQPGDKLGDIATKYNVSALSLVWANSLGDVLAAGKELRIPTTSGLPYVVAEGDTLAGIAEQFHVPPGAIQFFGPNKLANNRALVTGEEVFIPNGTREEERNEQGVADLVAAATGRVVDDNTNMRSGPNKDFDKVVKLQHDETVVLEAKHEGWFKVKAADGSEGWIDATLLRVAPNVAEGVTEASDLPELPTPTPKPTDSPEPKPTPKPAPTPKPKPKPTNAWVWPTYGDITSGFGYRDFSVGTYHNGIDIANAKWTPIRAARAGRVIDAGWCSGYGYCVIIDHGDGFTSEYGHMAAMPNVGYGQYVVAGQRIGSMGSTYDLKGGGYSTGVHLHFTIKLRGTAVSPMRYLP